MHPCIVMNPCRVRDYQLRFDAPPVVLPVWTFFGDTLCDWDTRLEKAFYCGDRCDPCMRLILGVCPPLSGYVVFFKSRRQSGFSIGVESRDIFGCGVSENFGIAKDMGVVVDVYVVEHLSVLIDPCLVRNLRLAEHFGMFEHPGPVGDDCIAEDVHPGTAEPRSMPNWLQTQLAPPLHPGEHACHICFAPSSILAGLCEWPEGPSAHHRFVLDHSVPIHPCRRAHHGRVHHLGLIGDLCPAEDLGLPRHLRPVFHHRSTGHLRETRDQRIVLHPGIAEHLGVTSYPGRASRTEVPFALDPTPKIASPCHQHRLAVHYNGDVP